MKGHILFAVFPSASVISDVASGHGRVKWQYRACANSEGFFVVLQTTSTKSSHATVLKETVYSFMSSPFLIVKSELLTGVVLLVGLHWWLTWTNVFAETVGIEFPWQLIVWDSTTMAVKQQKPIFWCCQGSHTNFGKLGLFNTISRFFLELKGSLEFVEEPTGNYKEEKLECSIRGRGLLLQTLSVTRRETLS